MTLAALGRREEAIAAVVGAAAELDARRYQLDRISNRLVHQGQREGPRDGT